MTIAKRLAGDELLAAAIPSTSANSVADADSQAAPRSHQFLSVLGLPVDLPSESAQP